MPQVSKRTLHKDIREKLYPLLFESIAKLSTSKETEAFLVDLLGPVELTMLAKRMAIALLLGKGYQYETIKDILKVSQETIARVNIALNHGGEGYKIAVRNALRTEKTKIFFEKIEDLTIKLFPSSSMGQALWETRRKNRKHKTALG